jgi:hypothetical protein
MDPFQQALDHSLKTYFINGLYLESLDKVQFFGGGRLRSIETAGCILRRQWNAALHA